MKVLVTYDIADDRRRVELSDILMSFGYRLQLSVYVCEIDRDDLSGWTRRLAAVIDEDVDELLVAPLCRRCDGDVVVHGTATWEQDWFWWA